jgi:hypothetical protein
MRPTSFARAYIKKARKSAEDIVIRWFKGMGIDVTVEKPKFEKEKPWAIKAINKTV